jgi:hypothetical protein
VTSLLTEPNAQDDSREFRRKLLRDLLVLGFAAVEIEPGASGAPAANLYVLDSGNLRVDFDQHGSILGFTQFDVNGKPILGKDGVHTFLPDEVIYYQLDPKSESRYPMSRIEQLFACAVIEQLMLSYIGGALHRRQHPVRRHGPGRHHRGRGEGRGRPLERAGRGVRAP